ncbi:hypothetical protein B0H13DRAFT_1887790 [Mycena leptocephala]|nr:hypothetical protein B0H13DRAFT_1887790 [Mycena leptocephala]
MFPRILTKFIALDPRAIQLAMRYAFPHLMINSIRGTSQKGTSVIRYALTDGRHVHWLAVANYSTSRKVDSGWPRARARQRGCTRRGKQCAGHVHRGPIWKVECAPSQMHASTLCGWFGGKDGFDAQGFWGRRRNEDETPRESKAKENGEVQALRLEAASAYAEVSDKCIDDQGCQGNAPRMSPRRCAEKATT